MCLRRDPRSRLSGPLTNPIHCVTVAVNDYTADTFRVPIECEQKPRRIRQQHKHIDKVLTQDSAVRESPEIADTGRQSGHVYFSIRVPDVHQSIFAVEQACQVVDVARDVRGAHVPRQVSQILYANLLGRLVKCVDLFLLRDQPRAIFRVRQVRTDVVAAV